MMTPIEQLLEVVMLLAIVASGWFWGGLMLQIMEVRPNTGIALVNMVKCYACAILAATIAVNIYMP